MIINNIAILIFSLVLSAYQTKPAENRVKLTFNCKIIKQSNDALFIQTELVNNADQPLKYLTMSCDSLIVYGVDNRNWTIKPIICQSNFPVILNVPAHTSLKRTLKLIMTNHHPSKHGVIRLRFNLYDTEDSMLFKRAAGHVVWSNNLSY